MSISDWLWALGLDYRNPGNNDRTEVDQKFREYITQKRPGQECMKTKSTLRDEWRQKFGYERARSFESPDEEQERRRRQKAYATMEEMLREDVNLKKSAGHRSWCCYKRARMGKRAGAASTCDHSSWIGGIGPSSVELATLGRGWSSQPAGAGGSEEHRQENASCPEWPHIGQKQLKRHQKRLDAKMLGEYSFCIAVINSALSAVCDHQENAVWIGPKRTQMAFPRNLVNSWKA